MKIGDRVRLSNEGKKRFLTRQAILRRKRGTIRNIKDFNIVYVKWDELVACEDIHQDFIKKITTRELIRNGY